MPGQHISLESAAISNFAFGPSQHGLHYRTVRNGDGGITIRACGGVRMFETNLNRTKGETRRLIPWNQLFEEVEVFYSI